MSLTLTPDPAYAAINIEVTGSDTLGFVLKRRRGDGSVVEVRSGSADVGDFGGVWLGADYEARFDDNIVYELHWSDGTVETAACALTSTTPWLSHALDPLLSRPVIVRSIENRERVARLRTYDVINRVDPVLVWDNRRELQFDMALHVRTVQELNDLATLTADGMPLLLRMSCTGIAPDGWYALGDIIEDRVTRQGRFVWTAHMTPADRPPGELRQTPGWVYGSAYGDTYADMGVQFPTYLDLYRGPVAP